jgi:ATP-binding cassette, subfamily B, bacterial
MRDAWQSVALIGRISWQLHPRATLLALLEALGRVLTALTPLMVGLMVAGVASHTLLPLVTGAIGLTAALGLSYFLMIAGVQARLVLMDLVTHEFAQRVGALSGTVPTLNHLENPAYQDQMQALRDNMNSLGMAYNTFVNVVNNLATPLTTLTIAATIDPRLLILAAAALPATWATRYPMRWQKQAEDAAAAAGRRSAHLTDVTLSPTPASELRVLGARGYVHGLLVGQVREWRLPYTRAQYKTSAMEGAIAVGYLAVAAAVLALLVDDALHGQLSPGRLATAVLVVGDLRDAIDSGSWAISMSARALRSVSRYRWLEAYARQALADHGGQRPPPEALTDGIRLHGVCFRYPGASDDTLRDVDLHLPAGSTVAVVGENGAGKSTLVGLLTGMRDLHAGRITIDGVDLRDLDLALWRSCCSGALQDHAALELTARDAIGVGDLSQPSSDAAIGAALARASATDVLHALPQGLDTQLGSSWPGGVGLSGGQWQRVAIARGMMRPSPLLLVLDEPTSALDPATEHALFDRYATAARRTERRGGITLLVTHRFSTVSAANLVIVLADGRVVEHGTHTELMQRGGHYAHLYELQAAGYR